MLRTYKSKLKRNPHYSDDYLVISRRALLQVFVPVPGLKIYFAIDTNLGRVLRILVDVAEAGHKIYFARRTNIVHVLRIYKSEPFDSVSATFGVT
jgi:hypothetical protein